MFIYILTSPLFEGQTKKIVSSFPISNEMLIIIANADNNYPTNKQWKPEEKWLVNGVSL